MSDIKKKIGKHGLDGLLNRPKEEPSRSGWNGEDDWDGFGYNTGPGHRPRSSYGGGYGYGRDVKPGPVPHYQGRKPAATATGVNYYVEDGMAILGDNELRRLKVEIGDIVMRSLKVRGIHLSMGGDAEVMAMIGSLVEGDGRLRDPRTGKLLKIVIEENEL